MRSLLGYLVSAHRRALAEPHELPVDSLSAGSNWRYAIWPVASLGLSFASLVILWVVMWGPVVGDNATVDGGLYLRIAAALVAQEGLVVVCCLGSASLLRIPLSRAVRLVAPMLVAFALPWLLTFFFAWGCEEGHAAGTCISD